MVTLPRLIGCIVFGFIGLTGAFAQKNSAGPAWAQQYDSVRPSGSVFIVAKRNKMGVVNATGIQLTSMAYDTIYNFHEGVAIVGLGKRNVNAFGKVLADFKYGYLDETGRLVVPIKYAYINPFSNGLGLIERTGNGPIYLYVNKKGKPVLNPRPVYLCTSFEGNTAYVEVPKQGFWLPPYEDGRNNGTFKQLYDIDGNLIYGNYIDRQGRLLIPWKYDTLAPYNPGYLRPVRQNGRWGFLDSTANLVVAMQYDDVDPDSAFFWQRLRRVGIAGRFGFMDRRDGRILVPLRYEDSKPSQSDWVWVRQGGRWGCLDKRGKMTVSFLYDDVRPFSKDLATVQKGRKWGLINTAGRLLTPIQYDGILPFREGRAVVQVADQFGFMDEQGREVIAAVYDQVSPFVDGRAYAKRWGLFITLNPAGDWIGFKLQTATLKWLALSLLFVGLTGFLVWKWRQTYLRYRA